MAAKKATKKATKVVAKSEKESDAEAANDLLTGIVEGVREETGDESAQLLGSNAMAVKIRGVISTNSMTLDAALGRGGYPLGRLTIINGMEGSGKTTLALHAVAEVQRQGGLAVYMDKEFKLDPDYAEAIGVDTANVALVYPKHLEQMFTQMMKIIDVVKAKRLKTGRRKPVVIVLDSINAAMAKAVVEGTTEDNHVAPEPRVWSRNLPQLVEKCHKEDVALIFVSQPRAKIGVMFGKQTKLAGGNAPKFYASVVIDIWRTGSYKVDGKKIGNNIEAEISKNQISPPFKKAKFNIVFGRGIDWERSLLVVALEHKLLKKSGAWWCTLDGEKFGNGSEQAAEYLREHDDFREKLEEDIEKSEGWAH